MSFDPSTFGDDEPEDVESTDAETVSSDPPSDTGSSSSTLEGLVSSLWRGNGGGMSVQEARAKTRNEGLAYLFSGATDAAGTSATPPVIKMLFGLFLFSQSSSRTGGGGGGDTPELEDGGDELEDGETESGLTFN